MKEKSIVLLSGGLDSVTLAHYVAKVNNEEVVGIFFDYGQPFVDVEYVNAVRCINVLRDGGYDAYFQPTTLPDMLANADGYNPSRNLVFLSHAARYAEMNGIKKIYAGFISPEDYDMEFADASSQFVRDYNNLIGNMCGVFLDAPFITKTKAEVYAQSKWLGVRLEDTWSCNFPLWENGNIHPCGECIDCTERVKFASENSLLQKIKGMF